VEQGDGGDPVGPGRGEDHHDMSATVATQAPVKDRLRLATEVALGFLTVAAILGMHRLFVDGSYRGALVLQALLAHLVVTVLRRARVRLVPAAAITTAAAVLCITWTRFPETAAWGLPTADTLRAVSDDVSAAWSLFGRVRAPAPVENGFVVTTAAVVWAIAFLADWAAFRVSATFEAVLPATTLFVFAAALGGDSSPVASAALFAVAALVYVLLHRTATEERTSRWAGGHRRQGRWSLVGTGVAITAGAVIAGSVAGPRLPGADADAMVAWRDINDDEPTRVVLSPMVSLQTKILEQPNVEVFSVRSERSSYWRLTSLDEFDGEIWRSSYSTDDADGDLPRAIDPASEGETVDQEITIDALASVWLPAALEPVAIDPGPDQSAVYDEQSSTLMVDREIATSDGYSYTVTSEMPDWTADELRTASPQIPDEIADRFLQLPPSFPGQAATEAATIAGGAATPYDKALALQNYFRSDRFTYDREVGAGHSNEALLTFLFDTRRGYCEQFASAYAALARSVGLPARVAVGFTPGVQDDNDPTLFRVRGIHAHAWPEVYLGEYGWVPFEPTITRGPPRAQNWLGIDEEQDTTTGGAAVTDPEALGENGSGSEAPSASGDESREPGAGIGEGAVASGGAGADAESESVLARVVDDVAPVVGVGVAAYFVLVPLGILVQQVVRRRRARSPSDRVRLGWRTATDGAMETGVRLPPWMTVAEKAEAMAAAFPDSAPAIADLAHRMEVVAYADAAPTAEQVAAAERDRAAIQGEVNRRQGWPRRILRWFDVRRLFGPHRRTRIVTGMGTTAAAAAG
jgi:transglutaminase-like putative cysteine protease